MKETINKFINKTVDTYWPDKNSIVQGEFDMITIDGKQYDETKFSPELQNYLVVRQEIQVNATRHKLELEKIEVLTNHYNAKIVELIKKEAPETEIKETEKK